MSPPHQRVFSTIHRVLHSIGKDQQQNQIKGAELADLASTRISQQNEHNNVIDCSAEHKLVSRQAPWPRTTSLSANTHQPLALLRGCGQDRQLNHCHKTHAMEGMPSTRGP